MLGCYNADALRQQRSEAAKVMHMEEIDLGEFSITLPHELGEATDNIVEFHVFGLIQSRDRHKVARALETRGPEFRARMLISVRALTTADFDEPRLTKLRQTVAEVMNGALQEKLIERVGFYDFAINIVI
jgi:hypothetical protein